MLEEILAHKREETQLRQAERSLSTLQEMAAAQPHARSLRAALSPGRVRVIAEVKRRSPSAGELAAEVDPAVRAALYADFGAAAISVLTDARYFGGSLNDLVAVRSEVGLPVLRKDFILNEYQVLESRAWGADAVLLIVSTLDQDDLADLLEYARVLGMDALVEVHDATELEAALEVGAPIIGVNNRNLRTLKVDLQTTVDLAPLVPSGHFLVSESGVSGWADVEMLGAVGVGAVLVGEALMRAADPAAKLRELVGE